MEIPTVFGMTWKIPSFYDISIILIITFSIILILLFLRYYIQLQEKKAHEYQLFLFKTRHMGLSGFQIKILNGIVKSLKLKDPNIILNNSTLYESALGNFLIYLKDQVLEEESLFSISKDVIIIYEKLYHPASFEKPLEKLPDIKLGKLVYFTFKNSLFIGKLAEKDDSNFSIQLFRNPKELYILKKDIPVKVYFFRPGDAEYTFNTIITNIDEQIIDIAIPEDFTRGKEVRHPNIDVIIKCI
ncbi:MAG: hypothetical protein SVR08_16850, partial [Spirochaetota bacterium]|nr:hypothetical protein [Spirochaetota bacterium]